MIAAIKGFVLSTIVASLGFTAVAVIGGADGASLSRLTIGGFLELVLFFGGIAAASIAVFVAAMTVILSKLHAERIWTYLVACFLAGFALTFLIPGPNAIYRDPVEYISMVVVGGLPGAVAGLVWWYSYRRKRAQSPRAVPA